MPLWLMDEQWKAESACAGGVRQGRGWPSRGWGAALHAFKTVRGSEPRGEHQQPAARLVLDESKGSSSTLPGNVSAVKLCIVTKVRGSHGSHQRQAGVHTSGQWTACVEV